VTIWQVYQSDGLIVFGLNRSESQEVAQEFADQFGLTFPILLDSIGSAYGDYWIEGCTTPFPRDFIIDQSGIVRFLACEYDPEAMTTVIDSLLTVIDVPDAGVPEAAPLAPNRPNPFATSTTIRFNAESDAHVEIEIFNASGARVRRLMNRTVAAGSHSHVWDGTDDAGRPAPSGVYFYRLRMNGRSWSRQLVLER